MLAEVLADGFGAFFDAELVKDVGSVSVESPGGNPHRLGNVVRGQSTGGQNHELVLGLGQSRAEFASGGRSGANKAKKKLPGARTECSPPSMNHQDRTGNRRRGERLDETATSLGGQTGMKERAVAAVGKHDDACGGNGGSEQGEIPRPGGLVRTEVQ